MPKERFVIVGSSAAGAKGAETIRRLQPEAQITVVTDEETPFYSRCLLPGYLSGEKDEKGLMFRPDTFVAELGLEMILGERVISLEPERQQLLTHKDRIIKYDKLLIATGSSSFIPPVPGLKGKGIFGLRSLEDAQQIIAKMEKGRRITIIGAGFVGLEAAYSLYRRGKEVTVIEKLPRVLAQQLDEPAAEIIRRDLQAEGVRLILGSGLQEVRHPGFLSTLLRSRNQMEVILENGDHLKTDLIIVAVGTKANTGFLSGSGVTVNRGIPVDDYMQTNIRNIYAAGDVAETFDAVTGIKGLTPIWPNAMVQGRVAGANMAGIKMPYSAQIAMQNAVEFREVPAVALGITNPPEKDNYEVHTYHQPGKNIYRKLVLKNNIPAGMILVGDIRQAGLIASLIRRKRSVTDELKRKFLHGNIHGGIFLKTAHTPFATTV